MQGALLRVVAAVHDWCDVLPWRLVKRPRKPGAQLSWLAQVERQSHIERMFDMLFGWAGIAGRRAGRKWSGCSQASRAVRGGLLMSKWVTAATAPRGRASAGRTNRWTLSGLPPQSRT